MLFDHFKHAISCVRFRLLRQACVCAEKRGIPRYYGTAVMWFLRELRVTRRLLTFVLDSVKTAMIIVRSTMKPGLHRNIVLNT
jgi:hypothetical protein